MNFLRKILLITIVAVFTGNTEGMMAANGIITVLPSDLVEPLPLPLPGSSIVDFDSIAIGAMVPESLQPKLYHNPVMGAPDKACVYFTVINNGNPNNVNIPFQNAAIANPVPAREVNVYFPIDGSQPTTEEAVEYSCANVQDDSITEWYMKMFGVINKNGGNSDNDDDYIKAGYSSRGNSSVALPKYNPFKNKDFTPFIDDFKKIASTAVGRVLLYRILIEIRRNPVKQNSGMEYIKSISVMIGATNGFAVGRASRLRYSSSSTIKSILIINHEFALMERPSSVGLVHELIHWYHALSDLDKYNKRLSSGEKDETFLENGSLSRFYHDNTNLKMYWLIHKNKDISFEDMLTILGDPMADDGNDISENLYRAEIKEQLRYGESGSLNTGSVLDSNVEKKVFETIQTLAPKYGINFQVND